MIKTNHRKEQHEGSKLLEKFVKDVTLVRRTLRDSDECDSCSESSDPASLDRRRGAEATRTSATLSSAGTVCEPRSAESGTGCVPGRETAHRLNLDEKRSAYHLRTVVGGCGQRSLDRKNPQDRNMKTLEIRSVWTTSLKSL